MKPPHIGDLVDNRYDFSTFEFPRLQTQHLEYLRILELNRIKVEDEVLAHAQEAITSQETHLSVISIYVLCSINK